MNGLNWDPVKEHFKAKNIGVANAHRNANDNVVEVTIGKGIVNMNWNK